MSNLQISQILGSSSSKPQHIAYAQECLLYVSGSFIIFYNAIVDEQISYLKHNASLITSICVSACQKFLAVCSTNNLIDKQKTIQSVGKKNNSNLITIYNLKQIGIAEPTVNICLRGHKYAIDHVVFSPDSKYLVSVCNKDGGMFVWDCKTGERLTQNKNSKNINSIKFLNPSLLQNNSRKDFGIYLVTTGRGTCKIWTFHTDQNPNILNRTKQQQHWILSGRAVSLSKKFATKQFTDVCFWRSFILLLTSDGLLCLVAQLQKQQKLQKCIDLMMKKTNNMDLYQNTVICGGESALVKVIDLQTLTLVRKFPKPPPNKKQNIEKDYQEQQMQPYEQTQQFPQCCCIKTIGNNKFSQFIVTIYSNLTLFIWRPQTNDIVAMRSIITHQASIFSVKILQQFKNELTFISTISEDNTLRIWHIYKKFLYNHQSIDIAQLIGIKRNAYCRNLTRIIYMQSQKNVTCVSGFRNKSVACIAHREFIMYSLDNFEVVCHEILEYDAVALQIKDNLAYIGLQNGKVIIYQINDTQDRLHKIRQISFDNKIKKMKIVFDQSSKNSQPYLLILTQNQQGIVYSLKKSKIIHLQKSTKCTTSSGHNILFCKSDNTITLYNTQKLKYSHLLSLKHEMTEISQNIQNISCNLISIVVTTTNNKLIVCNFSPAVVGTDQFNQNINDMVVSDNGEIIMVGDFGNIIIYIMKANYAYSGMEEEVKKWVQKNDLSWMQGSVWARKKSTEGDRLLSGSVTDSIRLKNSVNNRGSIKLEQLPNMQIKYKTQQNDQSIFNPSDILKQAKQIYRQIDGMEKKINNNSNVARPKQLQDKNKESLQNIPKSQQDDQALEQIKISFNRYSRPPINDSQNKQANTKKRIFITQSKQPLNNILKYDEDNEEGIPSQFRNNLVSSIIHNGQLQIQQEIVTGSSQKKLIPTQSQKPQQIGNIKKSKKSSQNKLYQFNEEKPSPQYRKQQMRQPGQKTKHFEQGYRNEIQKQKQLIQKMMNKLQQVRFVQEHKQKLQSMFRLLSQNFQNKSQKQVKSAQINRSAVIFQFNKLSQQFIKYISTQNNHNP